MILSGYFELSWWAYIVVALLLTHITIASVTIYLHRHQTHHALDIHPIASHVFRFWLWLTTGMLTREWVAIHRKHHARCESAEDPHSPQILGIARVLWGGVFLYVRESRNAETMDRFGRGTPDDWIERNVYGRCPFCGIVAMALIDILAFGVIPGALIFGVQMAWIPFWAAGVINGAGHYWGYRNYPVKDASTNLFPIGWLIGGEELHNNHHAFPTSAKFSNAWYELDVGWLYIRVLETLHLARVRRTAPVPTFSAQKTECDADTVRAILTHRYYVLAQYTRSLERTCRQAITELGRARAVPADTEKDPRSSRALLRWLKLHSWHGNARGPIVLDSLLHGHERLQMIYSMRQELSELWNRSSASIDHLVEHLKEWRKRAESSGIIELRDFSRRLPQLV